MISRSIASALVFSVAWLATVSAVTPLRAAAGESAAPSITVADAAQMVASEQASVDAEIGSLQTHIEGLEADSATGQVEADGVRGQADDYLKSSEVQLLQRNIDSYDASCMGRMLIGGQRYTCAIAHDKLQKLASRHNQTMEEFRRRLDEQNNRTRQIKTKIGLTRHKIQILQNYASWLELAREKIAKACGGLTTGAGSREEIEHRCGHVRFDSVRLDLPPCEARRCPAWGRL